MTPIRLPRRAPGAFLYCPCSGGGRFDCDAVGNEIAPEAGGHGVPEVMGAVYYSEGRIRPMVAAIKSLASSLSIGSGAVVGREGPKQLIGYVQWTKLRATGSIGSLTVPA